MAVHAFSTHAQATKPWGMEDSGPPRVEKRDDAPPNTGGGGNGLDLLDLLPHSPAPARIAAAAALAPTIGPHSVFSGCEL